MKKLALITGASSGIGKELARIHASKNGDLILVARRLNELEQLKTELQEKYQVKIWVIEQDLTTKNAAQTVYDYVKLQNLAHLRTIKPDFHQILIDLAINYPDRMHRNT
jgi:short-subunit dehydrogenase